MTKSPARYTEYHRIGIAIPMARKPTLEERLAHLGMKTVGDLATFFITADGVVEVLLPLMPAYREMKKSRATLVERRSAVNALKGLSTEELQKMVAMATKSRTPE